VSQHTSVILQVLERDPTELLRDWLAAQGEAGIRGEDLKLGGELHRQSAELLRLITAAARTDGLRPDGGGAWREVHNLLTEISRTRAVQGATPTETATFILSLKKPVFERLADEVDGAEALSKEVWAATELLDGLALSTTQAYMRVREEVIRRQQQELMELSTPVVKLWDGVLALPLIGTLDSARTQVVMESLLQMIVDTGAEMAIIDITGVPTVDTLVAQHLLNHQRHPSADRTDHRPPGGGLAGHHHQGNAGGRLQDRAEA
jgi:rsbT co-antagonist protein RsbR